MHLKLITHIKNIFLIITFFSISMLVIACNDQYTYAAVYDVNLTSSCTTVHPEPSEEKIIAELTPNIARNFYNIRGKITAWRNAYGFPSQTVTIKLRLNSSTGTVLIQKSGTLSGKGIQTEPLSFSLTPTVAIEEGNKIYITASTNLDCNVNFFDTDKGDYIYAVEVDKFDYLLYTSTSSPKESPQPLPVIKVISNVPFLEAVYVELNNSTVDNVSIVNKGGYSELSGTLRLSDSNNDGIPDKTQEIKKIIVGDKNILFKIIAPPTNTQTATVSFK